MRILILASFILLSSSTFIMAQDVIFGVKGGVNSSNASQEDFTASAITAFHLGVAMEARYTEKMALQTEILYSFQGFDYIDDGDIDSESRLSYINVPVMFKYYALERLSIEAGPQIGFLNTAKIKRATPEGSTTMDVKDGLRSNDLSFNIGLSFYLFDGFNIHGRYCYGLTNVVNSLSNDNFKHRVLQVSIGYFF
jgi:hypothetical protein